MTAVVVVVAVAVAAIIAAARHTVVLDTWEDE